MLAHLNKYANEPSRAAEIVAKHVAGLSAAQAEEIVRCFDAPLAQRDFFLAGLGSATAAPEETITSYVTRDACRLISPNAMFDETWYRAHYVDIASYLDVPGASGFTHFITYGLSEGRWPNETLWSSARSFEAPAAPVATIDRDAYLERNASAREFLGAFPVLDALAHYNTYGRFLHLATGAPASRSASAGREIASLLETEFDAAYYVRRYLNSSESAPDRADPFRHYLLVGIERAYSPNAWFQEDWYRAYYPDVAAAVPTALLCGFAHYLTVGRAEGRLPHFDLKDALDDRLPGITEPILIRGANALRVRLFRDDIRAYRHDGREKPQTVWFLVPTLNPDITFGGYRACLELIVALRKAGVRVAIFSTRDAVANRAYFLWRQRSERLREAFSDITVLARDEDHRIAIGPSDRIVTYTVFDMYLARDLAAWTDFDRPFLLTQEYEPIFFENNANKVLTCEAYGVSHYPIVNSPELLAYFRANRIGVFARDDVAEFEDYAVFGHHINQLPRQTAASMRARRTRLLAVYARPERHASRNLFELVFIALQNLCRRGVFGDEWTFIGLGALSRIEPLELGNGHALTLYERTTEQEYVAFMESLDIGISLMFAPHPGVVAQEFATTGALVVTNVFENRSAEDLRAISANIVPCEPSLAALEEAILEAVGRVEDHEARERDAFRPATHSWDEIFDRSFVENVFRLRAHAP